MNAAQAYNLRALLVADLHGRLSLAEIARVLRLSTRDEARKLISRAQWLKRQPLEKMLELAGVTSDRIVVTVGVCGAELTDVIRGSAK